MNFRLDEALVLRMAARANEKGVLALHSLATPRSTSGPVPVWIYQAVLASHESFCTLWWLKVSIFTATLFYAGLRLLRSLPFLRPETLVLLGLSPYVWFYSRDLWDNSWEIALSAVAIPSYLGFCCRPNRQDMLLTLVALTLGLLTHLMMLAPLLGIAVHFVFFHRAWGRRHAGFLLLVGAACGAVASSYVAYLLRNPRLAGVFVPSHLWLRSVGGAANALLAPRYFMLIGFDYVAGLFWWLPPPEVPLGLRVIVPIAFAVTGIAVVYFFIGLRESCRCVRRAYEAHHWDRKAELLTLFVLIYFAHAAIGGLKQLGDFPHYLNALWLVIFAFVALGVTALWGQKRWRRTFWVYALCLWIGLLYVVGDLHLHSGTRYRYGPTLKNQLAVADGLCRYPIDTPVVRKLSERGTGTFTKTVYALRMVRCAHKEPDASLKERHLRIGYVEPANPRDGRIALFESGD